MADVRREKELAEKRKNEPQLDEQRDQLVRKIFTKFRKDRAPSQVTGIQQQQGTGTAADDNKGDAVSGGGGPSLGGAGPDTSDSGGIGGRPRVLPLVLRQPNEDQSQQASCSTGPRPVTVATAVAPKKVSKWGKVLGGGSGSTDSVDTSVVSLQSAPAKIRDSPGRSTGNGNKVFPKLQKVPTTAAEPFSGGGGQRQETITEKDERLRTRAAGGGPEPEEEPPPTSQQTAKRLDSPSPPPPPSMMLLPPPLDLDVLACKIEELRDNFKTDVQSITQRLSVMENMMQQIFNKVDALPTVSAAPSPLLQPPDTPTAIGRTASRTKSTDDLSSPMMTPKLPPMIRRRRSKSRTRSSSSALPPMKPYSPRDTSPQPYPRTESLKKPCSPRPNDFL